jgi:SAM-dependent methyltransferase
MSDVHLDADTAAHYDDSVAERFDPAVLGPEVEFLARLGDGGRVLELAIGTGRVGLPLAERGIEVHGIDHSGPMLEQLRAKPGAGALALTQGDLLTTRLDGTFRLVYLVFNTITNLASQDDQVACFQMAADHLEPGGHFVVEVFVPHLRHLPPGSAGRVFGLSEDHVGVDEYVDIPNQILHSHHFTARDGVTVHTSAPYRYVWPSELDLMARLAGLELVERWEDWSRTPFTARSDEHVSVWWRPA